MIADRMARRGVFGLPPSGASGMVTYCYHRAMEHEVIADYEIGSPTRLALDCLAHRWTVLIILALKPGPLRFTQLRKAVPGVTSQVLTRSLRDLERDGMVARRCFPEVPPRVEYALTVLGNTVCDPVRAIRAWAERYGPAVMEARRRFGATSPQAIASDERSAVDAPNGRDASR